jgi:hypothetical protein
VRVAPSHAPDWTARSTKLAFAARKTSKGAVLQFDQVPDDLQDVLAAQSPLIERDVELELVIELQPADP